jgi:hypothetical protein
MDPCQQLTGIRDVGNGKCVQAGSRNAKNMEQKSEFAHRIDDRIGLFWKRS